MKCSLTSYYKGSFSEKSCAQVFKRALFFYRVNCHVLCKIVLLKISLLLNKTVHSFIGFFARTVIVEKWWLCSILSHKMGLQGHFYYMIKQSAFNIRKDSLANRLVQINYFWMRPDTFLQTLLFWVLCKDCFKWKLIAMFNFDTYNWVARTLLFVWTISIQYSQGQFGTWIIVQINYNWMQPDTILWTLFYKHSSFWFFARTVLNENW